jgi:type II restriction enzyme
MVALHPKNRHIHDKIRQQLQILRDMKLIRFLGGGEYGVVQR